MKTKEEHKEVMRIYYLNNKERWQKYYKKPQTAEQKLSKKLNKQRWKEEHPEKYLLSNAKYRSTKENIDFNLDITEIIVPIYCPYLKIKLTSKKGTGYLDNLMSIDRINPKKGYIKGNIEIISYKANRMKNNASREELLIFANSVLKKYGKK